MSLRYSRRYTGTISAAFAFCLVLAGAMPVNATNLTDIYEAARSNDPVVAAARASYQASRQAVPQARAALLPSINGSANTSWTEREFPGSRLSKTLPTRCSMSPSPTRISTNTAGTCSFGRQFSI